MEKIEDISVTNVTSNSRKKNHIPFTNSPVITKITSAHSIDICKLSINIYIIMYRVLYNNMGNTKNKSDDIIMR